MTLPTSRRPLAVLAGACLAAVSFGCGAFRAALTPPESGGPPWTELTSPHFVLETDTDDHTARKTLVELERSHGALGQVMQLPPGSTGVKIEVVLFERAKDFHEVSGQARTMSAYFSSQIFGDLEPQPVFVMYDSELVEEVRETLQHELAHRFIHQRFAHLPPWLDEGLAQYYSTVRVEEGRVAVGGALASLDFSDRPFFWLARHGDVEQLQIPIMKAPTVRQLIEADRPSFYLKSLAQETSNDDWERQHALYGGAWKLVQMLMNGSNAGVRARFQAFLGAIQRGERSRDAFLESFGSDWLGLERAYREYLTEVRLRSAVAPFQAPALAAPEHARVLSDTEVHLLWARLLPWKKGSMQRVNQQIEQAIARDPRSPEARYRRGISLLYEKRFDEAERQFDEALAARPEDPRYLFARISSDLDRAAAIKGPSIASPALVARLARVATSAEQLRAVARDHLMHERPDEGLPFAERAIRANPLGWLCQHTYSALLVQKGRTDEAVAANERAIALLPEQVTAPDLFEYHQQLLKVRDARRRRAGGPGPATR